MHLTSSTTSRPAPLDPSRALLLGAVAVSIELWLRRDTRFATTDPAAFAAYVVLAFLLFSMIAVGIQLAAWLLATMLRRAPRLARSVPLLAMAMEGGFLVVVALVPVVLKHVGLRYVIHPDGYTLGLLVGIFVVAAIGVLLAHGLPRAVRIALPSRARAGVTIGILLVGCTLGRLFLQSWDVKLIALENTTFTGQFISVLMRLSDLDRDGFPGRLAGGADANNLDRSVNPFDDAPPLDPSFGMLTGQPAHGAVADALVGSGTPPNVILVTIDTFAYAHIGAAGYRRPTTPELDAIAARGVWFERCFVPVGQSAPSYASIFTGTYPHVHGILAGDWHQEPRVPFLWDALDATHETLAFTYTRASHLAHGRSIFADGAQAQIAADDFVAAPDSLFEWLSRPRSKPFFAWLFSKALHSPHHLPAEMDTFVTATRQPLSRFESPRKRQEDAGGADRSRMIDVYDGSLRYVDTTLGHLWRFLEREGLDDETILIVTGDHGEAFYDHDRLGHGQEVYDEHLQVPLVIAGADVVPGRLDALVSSLDLVPTILELAGLAPAAHVQGRSLVPALTGGTVDGYEYLFSLGGYDTIGRAYYDKVAVRTDRWKLIRNPILDIFELYDLRADPGELRNLARDEPERREELAGILRRWPGFYPLERP